MNQSLPRANQHAPALTRSWLFALALSLLASLALLAPFFWLGSASGHDFEFHVASWLDVAYQWHHGVLYPRWTSWTNYGFGEPRYIFYPPMSWMLGAALTVILPISWVPAVFILLTQSFAGLAAFLLLRRLGSARAACFGAIFYAANPYALLLSYIRSDFAEQLACAIFPLLLLAALRLVQFLDGEQHTLASIPQFAIPFAAVWLCNAPAGVIASYSVALLFTWAALTQRSGKILLRAAAAMLLGFGLTAFYLVPAAYEQRWVNIAQALSTGLLPSQNFLFTYIDDVEHNWFNSIFSLSAVVLILFTALAALASRKFSPATGKSPASSPLWRSLLLLGAASTLVMVHLSSLLWNFLPQLRFVQFPWRWMSILAVIACCFFTAAVERRSGWLCLAFYLALAVPLGIFLEQSTWWDPDEMPTQHAALLSGAGFEGVDEYDPLGDDHLDLPRNAPLAAVLPASDSGKAPRLPLATLRVESWQPELKIINVDSPVPARVGLRLLNYPAWQITVNGREIVPRHPEGINQMLVPIAAGKSEIEVRFSRTPDRTAGAAISLFSFFLGIGLLRVGRRRSF
jgi:uncharacterized membrane protein